MGAPPSSAQALQSPACSACPNAATRTAANRYQLNATQELRGLGLANLAGAMFNCYTTTGSFSRSAVNNSVG